MVEPSVRLRADEAAPLLHALIARAADDLGVRVLAIKGPVVAMQGLRAERTSADVDVLVHPQDLQVLVDGLMVLGWRESVSGSTTPTIMPRHSVNLLNDMWPVGIDLHHYYPGFLANPGDVFDALWDRHDLVTLAGFPVPACDRVGHCAVVALHLLRDAPDDDSARLADLQARARRILAPDDVEGLVKLAEATDSTATLRPFLVSLGVPEPDLVAARDPEALQLWDRRTRAEGSAPWLILFARTPKRQWPHTFWHALMLTDEEIYAMHHVAPGEASLASLRWKRIRRGVRGMPRTVRSLVRERRRVDMA
jgi:hypothetical protein